MAIPFIGGKFQAINAAGPAAGALLYTYAAGTLTPLATYTDSSEASPNTNPVSCDANGQANVWLGSSAYRMILKTSAGVTIWDEDNITSSSTFLQIGTGAVSRTVESKLQESVSVADFGAVGDGSTDDLAAVNEAITAADGRPVGGPPGSFQVTSAPTNPLGVEVLPPTNLLLPVTGGSRQLNSYSDRFQHFIGKEYLYRVYHRLEVGTGVLTGFAYGDSTVLGNNQSTPYKVENLLPALALYRGLQVSVSVTNRGVSGTKVSDMSVGTDITAGGTDVIFIKYGINDGLNAVDTRLSTFASALRSKLAAIRAGTNGSVDLLSIVLVGPNATNDVAEGRDEQWYEQLRGVYVQAARDYQCAFMDTYALMRDSWGAAGFWMDDIGGGVAIHPGDSMHSWIWGNLFDWMFGPSETALRRANHLVNANSVVNATVAASAAPSFYPYGVSIWRATVANGWPLEGIVVHTKHADNVNFQWNLAYNGDQRVITRTAAAGQASWNLWSGLFTGATNGLSALTFSNSWVNNGGGWEDAKAAVSADGFVQVSGLVKSGTTTAGTIITNLPAGMRPAATVVFTCATNAGSCNLRVESTGNVIVHTTADATYTSLAGIRFKAA